MGRSVLDAKLIKADVDKKKRVPGNQPIAWPKAEEASHAVREYLAALGHYFGTGPMSASFHQQPEAQHPKFSAIHKLVGRLPHLLTPNGATLIGRVIVSAHFQSIYARRFPNVVRVTVELSLE
jgi:hypothetical protein